ncbi:MAG: response regulator, partial [Clostridiales bacterium]|nr:response regulator [Clostridiales bacterium]
MYNRSPSEGTFDSFVEFSSEGKAIQCSASFVTMAGLPSPAEIEGKTFHEIFSNLMDDEVLSDMAIVEEKVSSGKLVIPKRVGIKFYESDEVCDYILKAVPCNNDGVLLYKIYFFKMTPSLHAAYESQSAEMVYLTPLACAVIDEIGDIIDCNYSMLKMFDVSSKEEFIRDYQQFIAGINSFESYKECVVTAAEKGRVRARRLLRSKDGSDVCVEMIIRKIPTTKTFALYLYDLRKLEKVERFAENAENLVRHYKTEIKDVKKESVSKSRFLESISREIRTPMNAIIGMSDIMRTDNLDETQREFFTDIKKMSNALMQIINDILDFSHLEKGTLSLTMNDFNFYELYDNVCSMHKFVAMSKGLTFRSYVNEEIPVALFGDSVRIRQIISNLLNNAISFTNAGYIELNVDQETVGNQLFLCVNVRDTGVGIKEEEFDKVFILLESLDDRLGVGLELAITKTLIDLMGGEITFSSEYGAGSIFQVRIPVQLGDEKKVGTLSNISIVRATDDVEVLVVDDNAINLKVALAHLSTHNIHADVALNGAEAVEMALCKKYDMIFMDHMMPIMDGLEATKRIRAYGNQHTADYLSTVPILALSANTGMGMKAMFLKSGMNDFIPKPI